MYQIEVKYCKTKQTIRKQKTIIKKLWNIDRINGYDVEYILNSERIPGVEVLEPNERVLKVLFSPEIGSTGGRAVFADKPWQLHRFAHS